MTQQAEEKNSRINVRNVVKGFLIIWVTVFIVRLISMNETVPSELKDVLTDPVICGYDECEFASWKDTKKGDPSPADRQNGIQDIWCAIANMTVLDAERTDGEWQDKVIGHVFEKVDGVWLPQEWAKNIGKCPGSSHRNF